VAWRLNWRALREGGALFVQSPPALRRSGKPIEYEQLPRSDETRALYPGESAPASELLSCPRCLQEVPLLRTACQYCGLPFICDTAPLKVPGRAAAPALPLWRSILGLATLIFMLTNALSVAGSTSEYAGQTTKVIPSLSAPADNRIQIEGPQAFVARTENALSLLEKRAPDFHLRMQRSVERIGYMEKPVLYNAEGRRISMEGIGAVSHPAQRSVEVLLSTAFPSGIDEYWDFDVFSYAGVLVHELRHIELHEEGSSPGGVEEEVLCEEAAYAAMQQAGAPGGVLARYELYLSNPHAGRYQRWYDWYKQW